MLKKYIAYLLLITSFVLFFGFIYSIFQRYKSIEVAVNQPVTKITSDKILPKTLEIERLTIILPLQEAYLNNGKWEFSGEGAFYLRESPIPGEQGNSIIFGHNFPNVFGKLVNINNGDEIVITYTDGSSKKFTVHSKFNVSPDQTHILKPTDDTRLTIYTCSGWLDLKRLVITATPKYN